MAGDKTSLPNELWDSGFAAGAGEAFERERARKRRRRIKPILEEDEEEKNLFPYFVGLIVGIILVIAGFFKLKDQINKYFFEATETSSNGDYYSVDA